VDKYVLLTSSEYTRGAGGEGSSWCVLRPML